MIIVRDVKRMDFYSSRLGSYVLLILSGEHRLRAMWLGVLGSRQGRKSTHTETKESIVRH